MPTWTPWLALLGIVIGAIFGLVGVALGAGLTYWREYLDQYESPSGRAGGTLILV